MDVSCKDKVQAPTAIAKAQAGSSPKHLHVSSEAEDTALLYEKFRLREIEATAQEGQSKGIKDIYFEGRLIFSAFSVFQSRQARYLRRLEALA